MYNMLCFDEGLSTEGVLCSALIIQFLWTLRFRERQTSDGITCMRGSNRCNMVEPIYLKF